MKSYAGATPMCAPIHGEDPRISKVFLPHLLSFQFPLPDDAFAKFWLCVDGGLIHSEPIVACY